MSVEPSPSTSDTSNTGHSPRWTCPSTPELGWAHAFNSQCSLTPCSIRPSHNRPISFDDDTEPDILEYVAPQYLFDLLNGKFVGVDGTRTSVDLRNRKVLYEVLLHAIKFAKEKEQLFSAEKAVREAQERGYTPEYHRSKNRFCSFCKSNGETSCIYKSHRLHDRDGKVVCPILSRYRCDICGKTGPEAHTRNYCPSQKNNDYPFSPSNESIYWNNLPTGVIAPSSIYKKSSENAR